MSKRAWLAAGGLLVLLLAGIVAWRWRVPPTPAAAAPPAPVAAVPAAAAPPAPGARPQAAPASAAAVPSTPPRAQAAAPSDPWQELLSALGLSGRHQVVLDLCGLGPMPIRRPTGPMPADADISALLPRHLGADAQAHALEALLRKLDAGPARWRAAAAVIRGTGTAGQPAAAALTELANESADPVVSAWALQACKGDAACSHEAAQRWLQREPDNLAPWLELLQGPLPPEQEQELFARAARARHHRLHFTALSQVVMEATATDTASYLQPGVWSHVLGVQAAQNLPLFGGLFRLCPDTLKPGSSQAQLCAAAAQTLVERSDTLLGTGFGLRVAERSYMPKAEAEQRRKDQDGLLAPDTITMGLYSAQPTCNNVERLRASLTRFAQLGEMEALKAAAAERAASAAQAARPTKP